MIKEEEPKRVKMKDYKFTFSCSGAVPFPFAVSDDVKGIMTTYELPKDDKEKKYDEDDMKDKENG